jgi:hypothetical protein
MCAVGCLRFENTIGEILPVFDGGAGGSLLRTSSPTAARNAQIAYDGMLASIRPSFCFSTYVEFANQTAERMHV